MLEYEMWLKKAKGDLLAAEKSVRDDDFTLDAAGFHAQQCAEKALKGYLAYMEMPLQKTHSLLLVKTS